MLLSGRWGSLASCSAPCMRTSRCCPRRSERYSEASLKAARLANRMLNDGGSDSRLEEIFGGVIPASEAPGEKDGHESDAPPSIKAWEDGADEAARKMGAEVGG